MRRPPLDPGPAVRPLDGRLLATLWPFTRPHAPALLLGVTLMFGASASKLVGPWLVMLAIDGPMARGDAAGLALLAAWYLAAELAEAGLGAAQTILVRTRGEEVLRSLRSALFAKALRLPTGYLDVTPGGRTVSRITADVAVLAELFSSGVAALLGDLLLVVGILVALFRLDPALAAVAYGALPVLVAVSEVFRRRLRIAYRATREKTARLTGTLQEFLQGVAEVRLFGAEGWADREVGRANREHRDAYLKSLTLYSLFFPAVELLAAVSLASVLWAGGRATLEGHLTLGALVAFIEYLQRFFRPVRDLSEKYNVLQASLAALERIHDFLELPEERPGGTAVAGGAGRAAFEAVTFGYRPGVPVVKDVDLRLEPGEVLALVGPTGSGKTTLAHLLLGLYAPSRGRVRLDGIDLAEIAPDALRRQVALVPQDVFLFAGSVRDNVDLGRPWVSRASAEAAARAVGLGPAVAALPRGFDTPVLEGGAALSAGQRQLVAFARALAGDPRLLVLDEATSEVDQATEALIEAALDELFRGRTSLVVAHRLATVRRAHRIAVLSRGRVVETGSHAELLAHRGVYRTLYELQFRGPVPALT